MILSKCKVTDLVILDGSRVIAGDQVYSLQSGNIICRFDDNDIAHGLSMKDGVVALGHKGHDRLSILQWNGAQYQTTRKFRLIISSGGFAKNNHIVNLKTNRFAPSETTLYYQRALVKFNQNTFN